MGSGGSGSAEGKAATPSSPTALGSTEQQGTSNEIPVAKPSGEKETAASATAP